MFWLVFYLLHCNVCYCVEYRSTRVTPLVQTWDMVKKTVSVIAHSFLLSYRVNSAYILFISPLMYPRTKPWDDNKIRVLGNDLFHWKGCLHSYSGSVVPQKTNILEGEGWSILLHIKLLLHLNDGLLNGHDHITTLHYSKKCTFTLWFLVRPTLLTKGLSGR